MQKFHFSIKFNTKNIHDPRVIVYFNRKFFDFVIIWVFFVSLAITSGLNIVMANGEVKRNDIISYSDNFWDDISYEFLHYRYAFLLFGIIRSKKIE